VNKSKDVEAWFQKCANPLKAEMLRARDLILSADDRMTECIKWQTPTFVFGDNLASFNPSRSSAPAAPKRKKAKTSRG